MDLSTPTHTPAFAKVLRSFQTGGVTYEDMLAHIDRAVGAGAPRATLLEILRRREFVEPLTDDVREAVVKRIETAPGPAPALPEPAPPEPQEAAPDGPSAAWVMPPQVDVPVPTADIPDTVDVPALGADAASQPALADDDVRDDEAAAAREHAASEEVPISAEQPTIELDDSGGDGAAAATDRSDNPGPTIGAVLKGRYRLLSLIGEGGMSRVYKAVDLQQGGAGAGESLLALKVLTRPFSEHPESYDALVQDIATLQRLTHPGIVRMFECDRDGDTVFITMEYLEGQSLYAKLRHGARDGQPSRPLQSGEAETLVCAIGGALKYAHANQMVHGDLKPGNVLLTAQDGVKVIDFGLATWIGRPKTASERREAAVAHSAAAVTPRYASPQLMARQKADVTDDVYALACMAYELLSGSHPFDQRNGAPPLRFPPPRRDGISRRQYAALLHGLQFERRNRTTTVTRFVEEFTAPGNRASRLPWAAGLAAAALIAVVAWAWLRPDGRPAPAAPTTAAVTRAPAAPPAASSAVLATPTPPGAALRDCPTCPQMTLLPTGSFEQGAAADDPNASPFTRPQHTVLINYPLAMSTNAVTVGNFREFIAAVGRNVQGCETYDGRWRQHSKAGWSNPGFEQTDDHPVTCTSWNDALAYAHWLSTKTGHRYRLPTASEWEYAARAGRPAATPWPVAAGACQSANVADASAALRYPGWSVFACTDGFVHTAPVGSFKANPFGLNDMLGNVFVWTQDCWHENYQGAPHDGSARLDGDCGEHELRGGSWFSSPGYVSAVYRNHFPAGYRTSSVGIRLVREPGP